MNTEIQATGKPEDTRKKVILQMLVHAAPCMDTYTNNIELKKNGIPMQVTFGQIKSMSLPIVNILAPSLS